jgi:copper chaperone
MQDDAIIGAPAADPATAGPATATPPLVAFTVADMSCSHCVGTVRAAIQRALPGRDVTVDLASHQVRVAGGADVATVAAAAIRAVGYTPGPPR